MLTCSCVGYYGSQLGIPGYRERHLAGVARSRLPLPQGCAGRREQGLGFSQIVGCLFYAMASGSLERRSQPLGIRYDFAVNQVLPHLSLVSLPETLASAGPDAFWTDAYRYSPAGQGGYRQLLRRLDCP